MIERTTCRLCDSRGLEFVFSFPLSPLADRYATAPNLLSRKFPQDIYICGQCGHVQILNVLPPNELFDEGYTYKPSRNSQLSNHWIDYADYIIRITGCTPAKVLDIGSNDGSLLRAFKERGTQLCVGVEPVRALTETYSDWGISAVVDYWSQDVAERITAEYGNFNLVCANNVYAHNDDLGGFTHAIRSVLGADGHFSTEFSYLEDIISSGLVGVFFHEHLSHHHLLSLSPFMECHDLYISHAHRVSSQGGALILVSSPEPSQKGSELIDLLANERKFLSEPTQIRNRLLSALLSFRREFSLAFNAVNGPDSRIILVGASRSTNHLIDFLGIRAHVSLLLDSNPQKIGKFLFESDAPICNQETHSPRRGDIVIITAWAQTSALLFRVREIYSGSSFTAISLFPRILATNF